MEPHLNHKRPSDVPADTEIDHDEINRLIEQLQVQGDPSSYGEATTADLFELSPPPHPDASPQSSAFTSPCALQDSPTAPSLTTSSMTESPLLPEYDFPADLASLGDNASMMVLCSPAQSDIPFDVPVEWSMSALEWMDGQFLAYDGPGWSCEEVLQDGESSQPGHLDSNMASAASRKPDNNTVIEATPITAAAPGPSASCPPSSSPSTTLVCTYCSASFTDRTKLKIHTNKHTKPFRCTAPRCDYATAEKKSLKRHLVAKARWDEDHRLAADAQGVTEVRYRCPNAARGCTYATIREDNLKRHTSTCTAR